MIFYITVVAVVAALIIGIIAVLSAVVQRKIRATSALNADVIYSGAANHFLNGESVGGGLYLMHDKLLFKSHKLNIQNHEWETNVNEIREVRFYNMLGVIRNMLEVETTRDKTEKFVVNNRAAWKAEIDKIKQ